MISEIYYFKQHFTDKIEFITELRTEIKNLKMGYYITYFISYKKRYKYIIKDQQIEYCKYIMLYEEYTRKYEFIYKKISNNRLFAMYYIDRSAEYGK